MASSWLGLARGLTSRDETLGRVRLAQQVTAVEDEDWVTIVSLVILVFTILGAGLIIASMVFLEFYRGRPGTTRIRIVQALIFSDLMLGIIGLISSILWLDGDGSAMEHGTTSCSGLGTMLTTVLWTEHGWTLILAIATYMILIYPLHWFTLWLEKRWYYLWAIVWAIALMVGIIGQTVWGYYPAGGLCFYGDNTGLYSELMQFIPRAIVCVVITLLYAKLYVFLRRPDKIRIPGTNSATGGNYETVSSSSEGGTKGEFRERFGSLIPSGPFWRKRGSSGDINGGLSAVQEASVDPKDTGHPVPSSRRRSSAAAEKDIPPWERVELPPFQIAGEKFGTRVTSPASPPIWSGWKGLGRKRSSTNSAGSQNPTAAKNRLSSVSSVSTGDSPPSNGPVGANYRFSPPGLSAPRMPSIPSEDIVEPVAHQRDRVNTDDTLVGIPTEGRRRSLRTSVDRNMPLSPKSMKTVSSVETSPRIDRHRPSVTISEDLQYMPDPAAGSDAPRSVFATLTAPSTPKLEMQWGEAEASGAGAASSSRKSSVPSVDAGQFALPIPGSSAKSERGPEGEPGVEGENEEDEDDWDLMRMLAQPPPGASTDDRFAPPERDGEKFELVPESMSSYLNRKTALLMLWFPLGYVFLFSVSLIRLIYDFAGRPPTALRAISKWLVLGQGVLDAIIYGIVEWHTKRVVRKKVRKGTFSPRGTPTGSRMGMGSAAGFFRNMGSKVSGGGTNSKPGRDVGETSRARQNGHFNPTTSLAVPENEVGVRSTSSRRGGEVSFADHVEEWDGDLATGYTSPRQGGPRDPPVVHSSVPGALAESDLSQPETRSTTPRPTVS
ncbi:hypothetical protein IAU60_001724 [Kwoniella sp. DSM 27419]